jgi:hypothetical protein
MGVRIIKEMPGLVSSGTPCISTEHALWNLYFRERDKEAGKVRYVRRLAVGAEIRDSNPGGIKFFSPPKPSNKATGLSQTPIQWALLILFWSKAARA